MGKTGSSPVISFGAFFKEHGTAMLLLEAATGRILDANPAATRFYGHSREKLRSMRIGDISTLSPAEIADRLKGAAAGREKCFMVPHRLAGGEVRQVEVWTTPQTAGGVACLISLINDVTESELSKEKFLKMFRSAPLLITLSRLSDGRCLECNDLFLKTSGFKREEAIGRTPVEVGWMSAEDRSRLVAEVKNLGRVAGMEIPYHARDGRLVICSVFSELIKVGGEDCLLTAAADITAKKAAEEARLRTEEKYRELVEGTNEILYSASADGLLTYISPQVAHYGWQPEEVIGRNLLDFAHEEDRQRVVDEYEATVKEGLERVSEVRLLGKDGSARWFSDNGKVQRGRKGEITGVAGVLVDITARKQAEAERDKYRRQLEELLSQRTKDLEKTRADLADSTARYDNLVEHSHNIILEWDTEGNVLFLNNWGLEFFGFTPEEIIGRNVVGTIVAPVDSAGNDLTKKMERIEKVPDEFYSNENENIRKNGDRVWISWTNKGIRDAEGKLVRTLSLGLDRTAQRRAELELAGYRNHLEEMVAQRSAELEEKNRDALLAAERLALAARSAKLGVWDWDIPKNYLFWDDFMSQLYGVSKADFGNILETWTRHIHPEDRARTVEAVQAALRGEREYSSEFRITQPEGAVRWVKADSHTFRDAAGKPLRMVGINLDITESKLAEAEREKLEEQMRQSQKLESIGRLAGGVAHDFNNLLTGISGYAGMLQRAMKPDDPKLEDVREILSAAGRAAELTRQLLIFSRKEVCKPVPLDLNEAVRSSLKLLGRVIGENIKLEARLSKKHCVTWMDAGHLDQVLVNLAVNARDAMPDGGTLLITTETGVVPEGAAGAAPMQLLKVADTGCGMTQDVMNRIFEPFFTTKEKGKGTGLGMSTVYGIVTQAGGQVKIASAPGKGTVFFIYLPAAAGGAPGAEAAQTAQAEVVRGRGETVLLVEDERQLRELGARMLRDCGYSVITVADGNEALAKAGELGRPADAVISDMVLPGMRGRELCAELMRRGLAARFLYVSGYTDEALGPGGVLEEGLAFIGKPYTQAGLSVKLREVLDGPPGKARP